MMRRGVGCGRECETGECHYLVTVGKSIDNGGFSCIRSTNDGNDG